MQDRMEKFGAQPPPFAAASSSRRGALIKMKTSYLAKIAVVLQHVPGKMLTFSQLMDRLAPFICEYRKPVENNIRVCLSTNKCFVKVPVVPDSVDSKRNYWKLDPSQITAKMVRRHFKGNLHLFPELASKLETETRRRPSEHCSALHSPEPAACRAVQIRCEVKFSGPFSIESLLKRDSPSRSSPLSNVPVKEEQQQQQPRPTLRSLSWASEEPVLLQAAGGGSPACSTHHGPTAKRMKVCNQSSFPVYARAPYFTSPHSGYITYSVPTFTHDALRF